MILNLFLITFMFIEQIKVTCLMVACHNGHAETVRMLVLEGGADMNQANKYGETPCHIAAKKGHENVVSALIEMKINPFRLDKV